MEDTDLRMFEIIAVVIVVMAVAVLSAKFFTTTAKAGVSGLEKGIDKDSLGLNKGLYKYGIDDKHKIPAELGFLTYIQLDTYSSFDSQPDVKKIAPVHEAKDNNEFFVYDTFGLLFEIGGNPLSGGAIENIMVTFKVNKKWFGKEVDVAPGVKGKIGDLVDKRTVYLAVWDDTNNRWDYEGSILREETDYILYQAGFKYSDSYAIIGLR